MRNRALYIPRDANTIGLWQLDGLLKDEGPNQADLAIDTGAIRYQMGAVPDRRAGFFDGSTILARAGHDASLAILGDVTMEALVYLTEYPSAPKDIVAFYGGAADTEPNNTLYSMGIDGNGTVASPRYEHEHGAGVNQVRVWNNAAVGADAEALPLFEWIYLAMVRDVATNQVRLYVNGLQNDAIYTYGTDPTGGGSSRLAIGGFWPSNTQIWDGGIASVRISNTARTAAEISATAARVLGTRAANTRTPVVNGDADPATHPDVTLWIRADSMLADTGDVAQTAQQRAGALNPVAQGTLPDRPWMTAISGREAWRMWDGAAAGLHLESLSTIGAIITQSPVDYHIYTAFWVEDASQNNANPWDNHRIYGDDAGNFGAYVRRTASAVEVYALHNDGSAKLTVHECSLGEVHLLEQWYDTGTGEMVSRLDDGPEVRTTAGNIGGAGALEWGGNAADQFPGYILDFVAADAFDSGKQEGIRNYFRNRYGMDV